MQSATITVVVRSRKQTTRREWNITQEEWDNNAPQIMHMIRSLIKRHEDKEDK